MSFIFHFPYTLYIPCGVFLDMPTKLTAPPYPLAQCLLVPVLHTRFNLLCFVISNLSISLSSDDFKFTELKGDSISVIDPNQYLVPSWSSGYVFSIEGRQSRKIWMAHLLIQWLLSANICEWIFAPAHCEHSLLSYGLRDHPGLIALSLYFYHWFVCWAIASSSLLEAQDLSQMEYAHKRTLHFISQCV